MSTKKFGTGNAIMKQYDNVWAFPIDRIRQYFIDSGAVCTECELLIDKCVVKLLDLENRNLGEMSLPQTRVIIYGPGAECVYNAFKLNFLSGGA